MNSQLRRVQVKTSTFLSPTPTGEERWSVIVCTNGGNQSWSGITKAFDPANADLLYVLTGHGRRWLIPTDALEAARALTLGGPKYSEFELDRGNPITHLVYGDTAADSRIGTAPGEYPSGQRMATVNRPAMPSQVRILPPPSGISEIGRERKLGRAGQAIVRGKRLITIPAKPYLEAGFEAGDRIRFRTDGPGRVVMERIERPPNVLDGRPGGS